MHVVNQPVQYVALGNSNPLSPYLSWASAATNIQDALDAPVGGGSTVLVSNGVYRIGGKSVGVVLTNRVAITRPMTVQSVNGPSVTAIEGWQVPGSINGDGAVRCAYLGYGAVLSGFTLTNGATRATGITDLEMSGGGVWCQSTNAVLSNCVVVANSCSWWGAGAYFGTLIDCDVTANTNLTTRALGGGGGAVFSQLVNCRLNGNRTGRGFGGGARSCYLTNCLVTGNYDVGVTKCTLDNCLVTANNGTGIDRGVANNCTISSNAPAASGITYGGGATGAILTNCVLYANQATNGGGVYNCSLSLCTLSNNWAARSGRGIYVDGAFTICDHRLRCFQQRGRRQRRWVLLPSASSRLTMNRCAFSGNAATNNGGGMVVTPEGTAGRVSGCTFASNRTGNNGGGLYFAATATGTISNCSFYGNSAINGGGATYSANLDQGVTRRKPGRQRGRRLRGNPHSLHLKHQFGQPRRGRGLERKSSVLPPQRKSSG